MMLMFDMMTLFSLASSQFFVVSLQQRKCIQTEALQCPTKPDFTLSFQIIKNEGPEFSRICHTCPQMKQLISVLEEIIKQHCSISGNLPLERYCTDINVKVRFKA